VSRVELLDSVWGGAFVGDDAVSATIIKLRRAFDDDARSPRVIETVHKSGYRLIAPVIADGAAEEQVGVASEAGDAVSTLSVRSRRRGVDPQGRDAAAMCLPH